MKAAKMICKSTGTCPPLHTDGPPGRLYWQGVSISNSKLNLDERGTVHEGYE